MSISSDTRVAFIATDGTEQAELTQPWQAVVDAGAAPVLLSSGTDEIQLFQHIDKGETRTPDQAVKDADPASFAALVLPGGVAGADFLRADADVVSFVKAFAASGRPLAVICHAPWILVEAGLTEGRRLTSFPSLQTDLRNAGAAWVDEEVVVDGNLITSRKPDDLPAFSKALLEKLST